MYRSGNILTTRIYWNGCSWGRRRKYSIRCAKVFRPTRQRGVRARYQWELSDPQSGQWWIDRKYKMGKGKISDPNVTFAATDKDGSPFQTGNLAAPVRI